MDRRYSLLIRNGTVIDPARGRSGTYDVAVSGQRIAAVEPAIEAGRARRLFDASGCIVTPGFIDLHAHVYAGATYWGIDVDDVYGPQPVTTVVDAGSAGAMNMPGLVRYVMEPSRVNVLAFINISAIGLVFRTHELSHPAYCEPDSARRMVETYPDRILGIKARIDRNTVEGQGIVPLQQAADLAHELSLPLMTHISSGPPSLEAILGCMEQGDILTHCFTGQPNRITTVKEGGRPALHPSLIEAVGRGVWLDVGHGQGSFAFEVAEAVLAVGLKPHAISTDLHRWNVDGPVFTLLHTMAKFLALGMSLVDVVAAVTSTPAAIIDRQELGTLAPGTPADVAVFALADEEEVGTDTLDQRRTLPKRFIPRAVVRRGRLEVLSDPGQITSF